MPPEDWGRIKALFDRALSLPPMAREDFLRLQPGSPEVVEEALRLIRNHAALECGFLDPPSAVEAAFTPNRPLLAAGDLLSNRFRIRKFIGAGGMGQVYDALDEEAGVPVALKILLLPLQGDPEAAERFRRELLVARLVTHPNVCRLFDIGRHTSPKGSMAFLTMELLEGETLADRLRREVRLPPSEFQPIAIQVAAGLRAAHSAGVIHRDLKPGNILLTKDGRVVLTDFGLARSIGAEGRPVLDSITRSGEIFGTIDYMAPEQLRGERLSSSADLYALGLIAHEALTGKPAFGGATAIERATNKLNGGPVKLPDGASDIPRRWRRGIEACLACDPARRPENVAAFLALIEKGMGSTPAPDRIRLRLSRRHLVVGGVGVMSLSAGVYRYFHQRPTSGRGVPLILAQANAFEPEIARAVSFQMTKSLGQSEHVRLWNSARLEQVLQRMARPAGMALNARDWREVALRESIPFVLFASVGRLSDGFSVAMSLEKVERKPDEAAGRWPKSFEAATEDLLLPTIDTACRWARGLLGESGQEVTANSSGPLEITTNSWAALVEFSRGEELDKKNDPDGAILAYEGALRRDQDFTMALVRRGDIEVRLAREHQAFAAYARALETSQRRPLTRRENLRFRSMLATDAGDFESAAQLFAEYRRYFRDDPYGYFFAAYPLISVGRVDESIAMLEGSERFPERRRWTHVQLAWAYLYKGDRRGADAQCAAARKLGFAREAAYAEASIAYCHGETDAALASLGKAASVIDESLPGLYEAFVLADGGRLQSAVEGLLRTADDDRRQERWIQRMQKLTSLAYLMNDLGERGRAIGFLAQARQHTVGPRNAAQIGTLLARLGETRAAQEVLDAISKDLDFVHYRIARLRLEGELMLVRGRAQDAVPLLESAARLDASAYGQEYLANAYERAGRREEALREFERSLRQKSFQLRLATPEPAGYWRRVYGAVQRLRGPSK